MKKIILSLILGLCTLGAQAQVVVSENFWSNWFVQMGLDMTLQNPYGYDFSKVFPNGKTFGLDLAVGKWFTHQVGVRGKFNWENKLPLLENDHANWLAPFDQPGVNREKGGYIALYGDVLFNLHNFFGVYRPERKWNMSLYPRIGVNYNFGVSKGSLLAAVGVLNTYRLSNRWSLYGDIAYIMTGSGFVGKEKVEGTGTGSNSNGYLTIGIGAQMELGKMKECKNVKMQENNRSVLTNGIWDNWFVQIGADMSLMNPYGCNFSKVIPKGMTFGLNGAMGKWFTPEFGLKARVQWDNGLIPNNGVEWLPPVEDPKQNYKKGGLAAISIDAMLNLTNAIAGYDPERKWHTSGYVRAGIITQFVEGSSSPLAGVGLEETYRLNDRLSLFGALGYQVSTSEGMGYSTTGVDVSAGSNGFFDIDFGVRYDLGVNKFYRDIDSKRKAMAAQPATGHNWPRFAVNTVASMGVAFVGKTALKAVVNEERPDHSDNKSFPSGHAAIAFAAARSIDKEFRKESIWIPIAGYAAATALGVERVVSDRHHWYDVAAGAALGYGAAELTWWLSDKFLGRNSNLSVTTTGQTVDVVYNF
ncbi:MAG: phosphatase PAP2 family protein [Prevotella ruminicola]|uniref:Phosphatase PAP2 family protein n=1 Tax=Xylanibacter ruminicola TaxID=839 RepID=A0A928BWH7_XYLRU|nr:phosphatase PAP2 family protein [Xylanibacter ruminicola]